MNSMVSRIERLWEKMENVARKGKWSLQTTLYPSEIKRIERQWDVNVQKLKAENNVVLCLITWNNAFREGINFEQSWFISKLIDEMPPVETPAQQLFLFAARK